MTAKDKRKMKKDIGDWVEQVKRENPAVTKEDKLFDRRFGGEPIEPEKERRKKP